MRINTNISGLNAWRNLTITDHQLGKSLEKLSSGLRINRAADDAAGLAISERMRAQINGLNQAVRNAQDGISLIQTAEGALNEAHSILQRMRTLAVQAANDTYTTEDRYELQKEINQLTEELQRIGVTTEFNTEKLLDGSYTGKKIHIGANSNQTLEIDVDDARAISLDSTGASSGAGLGVTTNSAISATVNGVAVTVNAITLIYVDQNGAIASTTTAAYAVDVTSSQEAAEAAIDIFDRALNQVSATRAKLGAVQNRLEHTINNLNVAAENLAAAESRIRDVDMAREMMEFTRTQILVQAGTAMLAQANLKPQSVLQLLG